MWVKYPTLFWNRTSTQKRLYSDLLKHGIPVDTMKGEWILVEICDLGLLKLKLGLCGNRINWNNSFGLRSYNCCVHTAISVGFSIWHKELFMCFFNGLQPSAFALVRDLWGRNIMNSVNPFDGKSSRIKEPLSIQDSFFHCVWMLLITSAPRCLWEASTKKRDT